MRWFWMTKLREGKLSAFLYKLQVFWSIPNFLDSSNATACRFKNTQLRVDSKNAMTHFVKVANGETVHNIAKC